MREYNPQSDLRMAALAALPIVPESAHVPKYFLPLATILLSRPSAAISEMAVKRRAAVSESFIWAVVGGGRGRSYPIALKKYKYSLPRLIRARLPR